MLTTPLEEVGGRATPTPPPLAPAAAAEEGKEDDADEGAVNSTAEADGFNLYRCFCFFFLLLTTAVPCCDTEGEREGTGGQAQAQLSNWHISHRGAFATATATEEADGENVAVVASSE